MSVAGDHARSAPRPAEGSSIGARPATGARVGYLLKCFPRLSETFILNEVLELERQGLDLRVY